MGGRQIRRATPLLLAVALVSLGCADSSPRPAARSSQSPGPQTATSTPTASPTPSPGSDPFTVHPWTGDPGEYLGVVRSEDGSLLATWTSEHTTTPFRLYTAQLKPATPLLRLGSHISMAIGLRHGFLIHLSHSSADGNPIHDGWATMSPTGKVDEIEPPSGTAPVRRGDIEVAPWAAPTRSGSDLRDSVAYRPEPGTLFTVPTPPPGSHRPRLWHIDSAGTIWGCRPAEFYGMFAPDRRFKGGPITGDLVVSSDGGRHWRHTSITLASYPERTVQFDCFFDAGHLVLVATDTEFTALGTASLRWHGERSLTTHATALGNVNPFTYQLLPGGRLVFGTDTTGLRIATNSTNRTFAMRPAPVSPEYGTFEVRGGTITTSDLERRPAVSTDEGRTWRSLDLRGDSWTSAG